MSTCPLTGYGPRKCLIFDGDEVKYELREVIFLGYMRLRKLYEVITSGDDLSDEAKHADAFAEWVQASWIKQLISENMILFSNVSCM